MKLSKMLTDILLDNLLHIEVTNMSTETTPVTVVKKTAKKKVAKKKAVKKAAKKKVAKKKAKKR